MAKRRIKNLVITAVLAGLLWAGSVQAVISTEGLVSHWTFDEASGNTAYDSAGSNNGTLVNGAGRVAGISGNALNLDGINDYVNCGNNSSLDVGGGSFTISAWVKRPTNEGVYDIISKRLPTSPNTGWSFEILTWHDSNWRIKVWTPQEQGTNFFYPFAADAWYYVAAVRDAEKSEITYYINSSSGSGTLTLPFSNADNSNTANLSIGSLSEENTQYFKGSIDDVYIYNRALSSAEINELYNVPEPVTLLLLGLGAIVARKTYAMRK